jgi:hypothetical protein
MGKEEETEEKEEEKDSKCNPVGLPPKSFDCISLFFISDAISTASFSPNMSFVKLCIFIN